MVVFKEFLTPEEAAEYLRITRNAFRQSWVKRLPKYKLGNQNRFKTDDLRKLLESNRISPSKN